MSSSSVVPVRPHTGQAAVSGQQIPGRASNITLGVILICQLMVVLDATVVTIALPKIRYALDFSPTSLSWVQNAYTLTFGGFLLLGARAGDLLGRRRTLIAGISLFTISSLVCGLATNEAWLLTARAAQGLGGAIAAPATLALLTASFSEGAERLRALALYTAVSAGGASVGLVLGGIMTDWVSWRWALFINVPVGIALVLLAPRYLPESERHTGRFDLAGAITSTGGMGGLVYGFVRAASAGWRDPGTIGAFVLGIGLLATFVLVELRAEQPITPLRLLSSYERNASLVARLLTTGGMFGMFFFLTLYLQGALNYSPLRTGFAFVPMSAALFVTVRAIPKLMPRFGARPIMIIGSTLALLGMVWLTRINAHSGFLADLVGPMVVFGVGAGMSFMPLTLIALNGVAPADTGAASGLVNVMQQLGGALGLAVLVTVFGAASKNQARTRIPGLSAAAESRHDLAGAIATSFLASTAFLVVNLLVVVLLLGRRRYSPATS